MKKALLAAVCFAAGLIQAQAQPYLKQVITFSFTGYRGPEIYATTRTGSTYKPLSFKMTDKDLCFYIASENHVTVRSPQLVRILNNVTGELLGYYVMDGGKVVANADDYVIRERGVAVYSETDTVNTKTYTVTGSATIYAYDTWTTGSLVSRGMNTVTLKETYFQSNPDFTTYSQYNYSANLNGQFGDPAGEDDYFVYTGTLKATSAVVKTAIPGL